MNQRGIGAALAGWAQLIARGEFWFAALVLMALSAMEGYFQGQAIADMRAGGAAQQLGILYAIFGIGGFLMAAAIGFMLARKLGGDGADEVPAAVGKWIALMLAYGLIGALAGVLLPFFLSRFEVDPQIYLYAYPAVQLAVAVALMPIAVRLVAAAHSGNRFRIGAVARFLGADPVSWLGGRVLLGVAIIALGQGLGLVTRHMGEGSIPMVIGGLAGGLFQVLVMLWPIAAYRAMTGEEQVAETFF